MTGSEAAIQRLRENGLVAQPGPPLLDAPPRSVLRDITIDKTTGRLTVPTPWHMQALARLYFDAGIKLKGDTIQTLTAKLLLGRQLHIPDLDAIRGIAVVNGSPALYGRVALAVVIKQPGFDHAIWKEGFTGTVGPTGEFGDDFTAWCEVARIGGTMHRGEFSVADAKRAGLWNRMSRDGTAAMPSKLYPRDHLTWRARWRSLFIVFADALGGCEITEMSEVDRLLSQVDLGPDAESVPETGLEKVRMAATQQVARDIASMPAPESEPPKKRRGRPRGGGRQAQPMESAAEAVAEAIPTARDSEIKLLQTWICQTLRQIPPLAAKGFRDAYTLSSEADVKSITDVGELQAMRHHLLGYLGTATTDQDLIDELPDLPSPEEAAEMEAQRVSALKALQVSVWNAARRLPLAALRGLLDAYKISMVADIRGMTNMGELEALYSQLKAFRVIPEPQPPGATPDFEHEKDRGPNWDETRT